MYSLNLILIFFLINIIVLDFVNGYTKSEKNAIEKLRSLVQDVMVRDWDTTDDYLIKWLTENGMDLNEAAIKYRANMKWRKDNRIASIVNETILEFKPSPYVIDGYDKQGHPIVIFTPTSLDHRKLIIQGLRDKVVRYFFQILEKSFNAVLKSPKGSNGKNITRAVAILDLHGYNVKQHFCLECISVYREWFVGLEKYFPDALKHFIVINIPRPAKQLIDIIRPLLSPATERALKLFEPDKKQWSTYLLKIISANQLPYRFGGTKRSK